MKRVTLFIFINIVFFSCAEYPYPTEPAEQATSQPLEFKPIPIPITQYWDNWAGVYTGIGTITITVRDDLKIETKTTTHRDLPVTVTVDKKYRTILASTEAGGVIVYPQPPFVQINDSYIGGSSRGSLRFETSGNLKKLPNGQVEGTLFSRNSSDPIHTFKNITLTVSKVVQ